MSEEVQLEDLNRGKQNDNVALDSNVSHETTVNTKVEVQKGLKIRKPRKVLHFSDGTLEEYSTDEEDETDTKKESSVIPKVDPVKLQWGSWMWYWTLYSGSTALAACDYVGESLANFLGITSPKYQYEIEEFQRMQEDEEKEKKEQEEQMAGWTSGDAVKAEIGGVVSSESGSQLTTKQPSLKMDTADKYTVREEKTLQENIVISPENIEPELQINKVSLNDSQNAFMESDSTNQHNDPSKVDSNSTDWKRF